MYIFSLIFISMSTPCPHPMMLAFRRFVAVFIRWLHSVSWLYICESMMHFSFHNSANATFIDITFIFDLANCHRAGFRTFNDFFVNGAGMQCLLLLLIYKYYNLFLCFVILFSFLLSSTTARLRRNSYILLLLFVFEFIKCCNST